MSTMNGQWYPAEWPERIRALASGTLTPVAPRRAATVMLLRDAVPDAGSGAGPKTGGSAGEGTARGRTAGESTAAEGTAPQCAATGACEVYMLRRRASMAFAGGAYAYPGGSVDPRDEETGHDERDEEGSGGRRLRWAGPSRAEWAAVLGTDEAGAQGIVCAAVRETFEESGVLLAGPDAETVVADTTSAAWEADRAALVARELSFAGFLHRRGLLLRSDLLGCWARWITPEFEPRRYDTWFFVAVLPAGQRTRNASTEADRTLWIKPADAAAGYDRGEFLMMPPTVTTLREIRHHPSAAAALSASADRDLTPVLARARLLGDDIVLSWPGHDEFTKKVSR
ncbi:NUDIX hydrolase [Streptomyces sp. N2-109]|uniref:NUDIX hydrolase n=1 Tax=Streptomyces gossypii TaxID=2883101 RepID=A0ABT2JPW0_9ACTN|nr:NUDIX hydrolase [Streptomyces gossypii]MCT2589896.1 NUDIX hydrolase [Streptomyces gossypii]